MKKILIILGTVILSILLTFFLGENLSLYHLGTTPTTLTCIHLISLFAILEYIFLVICYIFTKIIKKEKIGIRKIISLILFFISLILVLNFILMIDVDWLRYKNIGNSAPFYTFILVRCLEFLLPSIITNIISIVLLKKDK